MRVPPTPHAADNTCKWVQKVAKRRLLRRRLVWAGGAPGMFWGGRAASSDEL